MTVRFDAIVIGTGQAGPALAARLSTAGMRVAVVERKHFRRHLREHRMHPDQDLGGERLCRVSGAARRRVWRGDRRKYRRRHEKSQSAQG